jgi:archaellum component FlaG (FlaF/FlaG flagellin family)
MKCFTLLIFKHIFRGGGGEVMFFLEKNTGRQKILADNKNYQVFYIINSKKN